MHRCFIRREHAALSVIDRRRGRVDDDDNDFSYVRFRTLNRWASSRIYFTLSGVTSEALVRYSTNLDGLSFQRAWASHSKHRNVHLPLPPRWQRKDQGCPARGKWVVKLGSWNKSGPSQKFRQFKAGHCYFKKATTTVGSPVLSHCSVVRRLFRSYQDTPYFAAIRRALCSSLSRRFACCFGFET
jgi:hypothetical protein